MLWLQICTFTVSTTLLVLWTYKLSATKTLVCSAYATIQSHQHVNCTHVKCVKYPVRVYHLSDQSDFPLVLLFLAPVAVSLRQDSRRRLTQRVGRSRLFAAGGLPVCLPYVHLSPATSADVTTLPAPDLLNADGYCRVVRTKRCRKCEL